MNFVMGQIQCDHAAMQPVCKCAYVCLLQYLTTGFFSLGL